jgi:hypothetical protein
MRRGLALTPRRITMHRASSPYGAGRTPTGFTPISAPKAAISNRNFQQLKTRVTHRKHSPDPKSNRNFRSTNLTGGIACRAGCSPSTPKLRPTRKSAPGRRIQRHAPAEAGSRNARSGRFQVILRRGANCAGLRSNHPQPAPTGSSVVVLGPGSIRAFSMFLAHQRTASAAGYLTNLAPISNRSDPRLEMPETYTKQRTGTLSNRHKFTHSKFRLRFASPPARVARLRLRTLAFALPIPSPPPIDLVPSDHHFHSMRGACNSSPAASLGTQISNRHLAPLERDVNIRKQKDPPILIGTNRHNSPTSLPRRSVTAGQRSALTREPLNLCTLPHGRKEREGDVNC